MKKLHRARDFLAGAVVTLLLVAFILPAGAAQSAVQQIKVLMGGIDIYVDQQLKIPMDAQGNRVEPMVYNGTTYLPVRAISNMLGKEVTWDGATSSIYIGEVPSAGTRAVTLDTLEPFGDPYKMVMRTGKDAQFEILGDTISPFNAMRAFSVGSSGYKWYSGDIVYKLDSDYKTLSGKFVGIYSSLGAQADFTLKFYNVDQYGTETLIGEYKTKCGDAPVDVKINVAGCNFLKIEMGSSDFSGYNIGSPRLYDVTLTTIG